MTRVLWLVLSTAALIGVAVGSVTAADSRITVDVNLITAFDTSNSVSPEEERLQRTGLAKAIANSEFLQSIQKGFDKRVGFALFAWSSHGNLKPIIPWTLISTTQDAAWLSNQLLVINLIAASQGLDPDIPTDHYEAPASDHLTDIASAIHFASAQLRLAPFNSRRAVINIVSNGASNSGANPSHARDAALAEGQVINGLLMGPHSPGLVEYYRTEVIGGPGSFVMQVSNHDRVAEAFARKFRMDLAGETNLSYAAFAFEAGVGPQLQSRR